MKHSNFSTPPLSILMMHGLTRQTRNMLFKPRWRFGEVTCRWYAFNGMFFGLASIGCLASIGLDRYMLTCRYHKYLELETKHYVGLSLAVWLNALFWAVMPLLGWSQYTIDSSAIACLLDLSRPEIGLILYILAIFIFCFVIPLTIVGITYYKAWMKILEIGDGGAQENIEWTNHKQITKMSVVVVVMFCFTWSPYAMVHLYCIFRTTRHIPPALSIVPALLAKSSAVYNPYIYAIVNKRFRLALKKMCGCICTRNDRQALQIHNLC
ncbi:hypothetical protein LOTGIDRAFT_155231 [Lottia gigantea]|uniref:G-protein coupled receptors family 1 profile domain-containing protein n=1 Tax=Lottia gigantea TaxID=225164 RepID=V3Z0E3_LOTGI|nr:hypothetical protein LOTGIDRAFT_155231 [Lottia gigantea]ESO83928.1 hypothetical protein LOTGIDRAFT_155231 [Lottia gigantea]